MTTSRAWRQLPAASRRAFTQRVVAANNWQQGPPARRYPPFKHVIYIIKENRTFDQVLGDMKEGDGDASLVYFPDIAITPNHHALARRFGLFDRFFVNAEVSSQGCTSAVSIRDRENEWLVGNPPNTTEKSPLATGQRNLFRCSLKWKLGQVAA